MELIKLRSIMDASSERFILTSELFPVEITG